MAETLGLARRITANNDALRLRLRLGRAHWDDLIERIERAERGVGECYDEQLWTFILACVYASSEGGPTELAGRLSDRSVCSDKIWFEVLPRSPRRQEGPTNLDLALGHLDLRYGTDSGVELRQASDSEIIFCEFKWYSDIDCKITYDRHRNQLARVIENALLFRSNTGNFANRAHVCLVTPSIFRDKEGASRLYRYKWEEYTHCVSAR
jgi:hypothetical protein